MNPQRPDLIPVLRRPRREWEIPTVELYVSQAEREAEEAARKAFCAGTTPFGREIFRRALGLASDLVEKKGTQYEAAKEVSELLGEFPEIHTEFVLLLSRTLETDPEELRQGSVFAWAVLTVTRARLIKRINDAQGHDRNNPQRQENQAPQ